MVKVCCRDIYILIGNTEQLLTTVDTNIQDATGTKERHVLGKEMYLGELINFDIVLRFCCSYLLSMSSNSIDRVGCRFFKNFGVGFGINSNIHCGDYCVGSTILFTPFLDSRRYFTRIGLKLVLISLNIS